MGLILVIARKRPNLIPTRLHSECQRAARAACRHTATCATVPNFEQHHSFGAAGLAHSDPREAQTRNLGGPLPSTAATIPQKDPPGERRKSEIGNGRKGKTQGHRAHRATPKREPTHHETSTHTHPETNQDHRENLEPRTHTPKSIWAKVGSGQSRPYH